MSRILIFLVIAYIIFLIIRLALKYFIHDKKFKKNNKKKEKYDKSKAVDATFEEIK